MAAKKIRPRTSDTISDDVDCCCPPCAHVWIDARSSSIFVENSITETRHLAVTADLGQSAVGQPTATLQSGHSDSDVDTTTTKQQGKVYRTDSYTIHWRVDAQCKPVRVRLRVDGEVSFDGGCLPEQGEMTLSHAFLLEPPNYAPAGPGFVSADVEGVDCAKKSARCGARVKRP